MNYKLAIGINLDDRKLTLNIPDNTNISELKYVIKTDNQNNYIIENDNKGFIHYVENGEEINELFYVKGSVNLKEITLPDNFGTIIEVDETSKLYNYILRKSHEKVYVVSEDFAKEESMNKDELKTEIEETVRGYGVPIDTIMGFDGMETDIPGGYEIIDNPFVQTDAEIRNTYSESSDEVYSCYYINILIENIGNLLDSINGEVI